MSKLRNILILVGSPKGKKRAHPITLHLTLKMDSTKMKLKLKRFSLQDTKKTR